MTADTARRPTANAGVGQNVLLTGGTGFLGAEIMKRVLLSHPDSRMTLLVRSSPKETADERVGKLLLQHFPPDEARTHRARIDVIEGDISVPRFGMDLGRAAGVKASVDHVIHCAASVRFDLPLDLARRDNTEGTRNVLELAGGLDRLHRFDYVGTAYVAGGREGLVREDELDMGQRFSNSYERTKMEAETLVRAFAKDHPTSIHRPSIIVGDSKTGETTSFTGMYHTIVLFKAAYSKGLKIIFPADPRTKVDIVPVDYVVDALFGLMATPKSIGKCHHLTSGPGFTRPLGELVAQASAFLGIEPPPYVSLDTYRRFLRPPLRAVIWGKKRKLMQKGEYYMPYGSAKFEFDKTNTNAGLEGTGIKTPHPSDYFLKLLQFQAKADARTSTDRETRPAIG